MGPEPRQPSPPCPMCGKPDGARMSATEWGHDYACCSNSCGFDFKDSYKQLKLEVERAEQAVLLARAALAESRKRLSKARAT